MTFADKIEMLCRTHDGSVSGGGRTPKRNRDVGGVAKSKHLTWQANDVILDDWNRKASFIYCAEKLGLWVKDETNTSKPHLHVQEL